PPPSTLPLWPPPSPEPHEFACLFLSTHRQRPLFCALSQLSYPFFPAPTASFSSLRRRLPFSSLRRCLLPLRLAAADRQLLDSLVLPLPTDDNPQPPN
ncbi:hypothetical protein B296_00036463, partial [Ensete ventricosum]